jgi:hypothetical protein
MQRLGEIPLPSDEVENAAVVGMFVFFGVTLWLLFKK